MRKMIILSVILAAGLQAKAMSLDDYLGAVEQKHGSIRALNAAEEAVADRKTEGDKDLAPTVSAAANYTDDKKEPNQLFQFGGYETKTTQYSLGLNKKFSTGTNVGLSANAANYENPGVNMAALAAYLPAGSSLPSNFYLDKYGTGSLGLSISQSLWKDFFGNATKLRWDRENQTAASQKAGYDLQKRQLLIGAEGAYWDYIYAQEELKIQQASLGRSQKIASWTQRRVNDGISDRADLLQTQALVAQRQLQLIATQNDFLIAQKSLRDYLELKDGEPLPPVEGNISAPRPLRNQINGTGKIVQLDAYVSALDAKAKAATSAEVEDSNRPDLVLKGSYNTNSYEPNVNSAVNKWGNTSTPTAQVGVNFNYMFDTDAKSAGLSAARKEALSAKLTSDRKMLESESSWSELNRQYEDLTHQIDAATTIFKLQEGAAKAQADKFNKGRSVTLDVVTAEQNAADAELNLTKLKSTQRKMEAQSRLFMAIDQ